MNWLKWLNISFILIFTTILVAAFVCKMRSRPSSEPILSSTVLPAQLPQNSFQYSCESYAALAGPALALAYEEPTALIPNLTEEIAFLGLNRRPDAKITDRELHFAFKGSDEMATLILNQPCYLTFDRGDEEGAYCPIRDQTNLWITPESADEERVSLRVAMKSPDGMTIEKPPELARFELSVKARVYPGGSWMLSETRVDSSLLARQRARWAGPDLFLEVHGGEEFAHTLRREQLLFGPPNEGYSNFVREGEGLIWDKEQWREVTDDDAPSDYPLLFVRKIDDNLMLFDLWDVGGKQKISLSLMRSKARWFDEGLLEELQFCGVRRWDQFVVQHRDERITLSPEDWLLATAEGEWIKIDSVEEIDDYVLGKLQGELLVIDRLGKEDGINVVTAHLFNVARSEMKEVAFPILGDAARQSPLVRECGLTSKAEQTTEEEVEGILPFPDFDEEWID